jgi:hypothetical protein
MNAKHFFIAVVYSYLFASTSCKSKKRIPETDVIYGNVLTYYTDAGYGACGAYIDASSGIFASVPAIYWTSKKKKSYKDPLCKLCVSVSYNGNT